MNFLYSQSTGLLEYDEEQIARGYSGHGAGLNNPAMQNVRMVGPVPQGKYTICPANDAHPHLGPVAMELTPWNGNAMFLRSGFFIHGDNAEMNHTASDGCIILPRDVRERIAALVAAGENELEVTA